MSIADKVRAIYGIRRFLDKYEIAGNIENDRHINLIFLEFAKDMGWFESFQHSKKKGYRGHYDSSMDNAPLISANFQDFQKWVKSKYVYKHKVETPLINLNTQNKQIEIEIETETKAERDIY